MIISDELEAACKHIGWDAFLGGRVWEFLLFSGALVDTERFTGTLLAKGEFQFERIDPYEFELGMTGVLARDILLLPSADISGRVGHFRIIAQDYHAAWLSGTAGAFNCDLNMSDLNIAPDIKEIKINIFQLTAPRPSVTVR